MKNIFSDSNFISQQNNKNYCMISNCCQSGIGVLVKLAYSLLSLLTELVKNGFKVVVKKTFRYSNVFSTTTYTPIPQFGTLLWKAV
jgi:hypothetical protein